jgi:uncharacterized repeat protein (TIGR01451 family)
MKRKLSIGLFALLLAMLAAALPAQAAVTVGQTGDLGLVILAPETGTLAAPLAVALTVTNGTSAPTGSAAQVSLVVPIGAQLQGGISISNGGTCAKSGGGSGGSGGTLVVCQLASLAPGATATLNFSVLPLSLGTLDLTIAASNAGSISSGELSVPISPAPTDVQVTGAASTGSPALGAAFSYTFQVKNNGPWPAPAVAFSDALPSNLSFAGMTSSTGTCTEEASSVSCAFGDMAVGAQANVVISVTAPITAQTITNTASVNEAVTDRQPSNNQVSVTVQTR